MNVNEFNVQKSTLFLCLHNSFLKKLTLQYFSVVVRTVPPEEIGRGSFPIMSSLSMSLMFSLLEKVGALRTIHQPQASRWDTQHQWVMKSCCWKDENWWYSITKRIDGYTYGNQSSSFTRDSFFNLLRPNLRNNVRRLYDCRYSCFVNVIHCQ
jgi:hypothetical protein